MLTMSSDVMVSKGHVADTELGLEASRVIKRVGLDVKSVKNGDRVAAFCLGTYRTLLRTHETLIAPLPDGMSFEDGAALPAAFGIAYHGIVKLGSLTAGETILIHSGAGGKFKVSQLAP